MINGNMIGGSAPLKTVILMDENGNEVTGVVTGSEVIFTATDNDVREGVVYASDAGVSTGTKNIPSYRTTKGVCLVSDGDEFSIMDMEKYDRYDYTELQCIIAPLETTIEDSIVSDKIVLNNNVYNTNSSVQLSAVTKDYNNKSIKLNIINNSGKDYVIHFFTYREEDYPI